MARGTVLLAVLGACAEEPAGPATRPAATTTAPAGSGAPAPVDPAPRPLTDADVTQFLSVENEVVERLGLPPAPPAPQQAFVRGREAIVRSRGLEPQAYERVAERIYGANLAARLPVTGRAQASLQADVALVRRHLAAIDALMQRKRALAQKQN